MDFDTAAPRFGRLAAFLIVFLTWVAIYLPALGAREFRGEETRRVLPAVEMLKTGRWLVPQVGGELYYRKPPVINWLVAASFVLTGEQTELTARLPSVVFVLAFAAAAIWGGGRWLRIEARLIAALLFLTSVAMIEKGRQIEIEAVYISQTSIAILLWLTLWAGEASPWTLWLAPSLFLTMGMLTKGPPILVFYYAPVIGVLAYSGRLRTLLSAPHVISLALSLGVPAGWAYLAMAEAARQHVAAPVAGELLTRLTSASEGPGQWARNVGKSFINLLPWGAFLPLLWRRDFLSHLPADRLPLLKGARLGLVISFLAITLVPGNSGRYGLPVLGLMSLLLGWVLGEVGELPDRGRLWRAVVLTVFAAAGLVAVAGFAGVRRDLWSAVALCGTLCLAVLVIRERRTFHLPIHLAVLSAAATILLMTQYSLLAPSRMAKTENRRPVAARVNALVPSSDTIYVLKPGHQGFLFYIRQPFEYVVDPSRIDERVRFLLLREDAYRQLKDDPAIALRRPGTLYSFAGHSSDFRLLELHPPNSTHATP
jgi:4-amino-4-deoxy-L-arabinose transferase-like glycosyltransferase